jgi:general nucleoside transport system permease protein
MELLDHAGDIFGSSGFFEATLRIGVVFLLGTLGELVCERAGVMNLGIEGIMVLGAMTGFTAVFLSGSLWLGVLAAVAAGGLAGYLHGVFSIKLALNQHVTGIALTLLASGLAFFGYRLLTEHANVKTELPQIDPFDSLAIPLLSDIPGVGPVLFDQTPLAYLAFLLVPAVWYVLARTPAGLVLRTAGENPLCLESAGISAHRVRMVAVVAGSMLMGLAGAYLSTSYFNAFQPGIVSGRGWICIALVIFANWRAARVLLGALLFAAVEAVAVRIQALGIDAPSQLFLMLPYVLTIVALVAVARRAAYPAALLVPFRRGERV